MISKDINSKTISAFGTRIYLSKEIIELHHSTIQVESFKTKILPSHLYYRLIGKSLTNKY